ncbi:MAG: gamma-glutamyl-gamma-aminobutyrate hydrolase family protein [Acidobacteria bacterium]|nr:gamma-glutamyl-gamma-aminobutyrate hydrolase family protein [Acidobacteriota bacterium]
MTRPLVCIPTRIDPANPRFYLRRHYSDALYAAGATPVLLPLIPDRIYIEDALARAGGVVLSGSNSDVDPARYHEEPLPQLGHVVRERDEVDQLLLGIAEERRLPVLAICYGIQALNVFRGGTLYQDIQTQVKNAIKHEQGEPYGVPSHTIVLEERSLLSEIAGRLKPRVNSHHHQAINQIGRGLKPIAWASDGLVEAVVADPSEQWVLGVQWHPEASAGIDDFSRKIFAEFVEAVRGQRPEARGQRSEVRGQ